MARRVAVLLNLAAQGVTPARLRWFRAHVPAADLFVPDGVAGTRAALAEIARAYDVVCTGGGDGTFMLAAEVLVAQPRMPAVLPLRLGTGNAVHDTAGSSPATRRGLAQDLARAADPATRVAPLRLLEVDGRLTQFAGVGLDADWAADYAQVIKRHAGPLLPLVRGVPGYALTALTRTIPRLIRRPFVTVTLTAPDGATALDGDGRVAASLPPGATLYAGPVTMASMSTVASYSAGFRYFRHVDGIGDAFELKVAVASARQVLQHARRLLAGAPDPRLLDFAVRTLRVELPDATRYHVGGDIMPATHRFTVGTSARSVPVLRLR